MHTPNAASTYYNKVTQLKLSPEQGFEQIGQWDLWRIVL